MELHDAVTKLKDKNLGDFVLSASSKCKVDHLFANFNKLNDVELKLQLEGCSLQKARAYFKSV